VDQDRTENGFFGFEIVRKRALGNRGRRVSHRGIILLCNR
jgi:hypothetical protein